MVKKEGLSKRLAALGFPMFECRAAEDANLTLADVVRSNELRLWEGFPVMLANSAMREMLDCDKVSGYLKLSSDRARFESLLAMSLALYKTMGLRFSWVARLRDSLSPKGVKQFGVFLNALKKETTFKMDGTEMSANRLKNTFNNYFSHGGQDLNELLSEKDSLGVEYALSQLFSPKQKELFLKKLQGSKFTKTDREYYSRAVKKKVLALANAELHRLARKLLEQGA